MHRFADIFARNNTITFTYDSSGFFFLLSHTHILPLPLNFSLALHFHCVAFSFIHFLFVQSTFACAFVTVNVTITVHIGCCCRYVFVVHACLALHSSQQPDIILQKLVLFYAISFYDTFLMLVLFFINCTIFVVGKLLDGLVVSFSLLQLPFQPPLCPTPPQPPM